MCQYYINLLSFKFYICSNISNDSRSYDTLPRRTLVRNRIISFRTRVRFGQQTIMRTLVRIRVTISNYFVEKLLVFGQKSASDNSLVTVLRAWSPSSPSLTSSSQTNQSRPRKATLPWSRHLTLCLHYTKPYNKKQLKREKFSDKSPFELVKRSFRIWQFAFFSEHE